MNDFTSKNYVGLVITIEATFLETCFKILLLYVFSEGVIFFYSDFSNFQTKL